MPTNFLFPPLNRKWRGIEGNAIAVSLFPNNRWLRMHCGKFNDHLNQLDFEFLSHRWLPNMSESKPASDVSVNIFVMAIGG
jgi:hypothetical protein